MIITRTGQLLEVGLSEGQTVSIDMDHVRGASLAAERAPCGRLHNALLVFSHRHAAPRRIEDSFDRLCEVHRIMIEIMQEVREVAPVLGTAGGQPAECHPV